MTRQMTVQDAAKYLHRSERTIRRKIKEGTLSADLVNGRWNVHIDVTNDMSSDNLALIDQVQSENEYLKEQVSHLTQLLAVSQKSIQQLTEQNQLLLGRVDELRKKDIYRDDVNKCHKHLG